MSCSIVRHIVRSSAGFLVLASSKLAVASPDAAGPGYWTHPLPLHPKLVHVPMALCILMPMVVGLIWTGVRRGWFTPHAWLIAVFLQGATLVGGLAALQTGKSDGVQVEGYASDDALATHEARAEWFLYIAGVNLGLCGATWLLWRDRRRQHVFGAVAALALVGGSYAGYRVGDAGGRLVYVGNASDAHR